MSPDISEERDGSLSLHLCGKRQRTVPRLLLSAERDREPSPVSPRLLYLEILSAIVLATKLSGLTLQS